MNVPFYIAKKYLSSKKKKNVIHLITRISIIGIAVTTAALIVLLAAFNGIESMVERLYSEFDSNLTIRSVSGKSFDEDALSLSKIKAISGVKYTSKAIEEVVILKHEKKWVNAKLYGVEPSFLKLIKLNEHIVDGKPKLEMQQPPLGIIGARLLDNLNGFIPEEEHETIIIYAPKRNARVTALSNPFHTDVVAISARLNYNKEVNEESLLVPLEFAQNLLDYDKRITAVYVNCTKKEEIEPVKEKLSKLLGPTFEVKTHFEKNALIYQTSKTEKVIVITILVFIFILAIFNLISSLTMLYIEKKDNIGTLKSMGATKRFIFNIFFYEGLLISFKGIVYGIFIGLLLTGLQYYFKLIILPNSGGLAFPMWLTWSDSLLVVSIVSIISIGISYITIAHLTKNQ